MSRPRLLDLFCGAGGAAVGYHRAGFDVVGVDIKPQPNYPFEFVQADALLLMETALAQDPWSSVVLDNFGAIHASPPCQRYSTATKRNGTGLDHPDLIGPTRELLEATGLPYVIENVVGAPLHRPILLCGATFNLYADGYRLRRHRLFECGGFTISRDVLRKTGCMCSWNDFQPVMDVTGGGPTKKERTDGAGGRPYKGTADQARRIMGIDWMTKAELNEAVPPAYTQFIGEQLLAHLGLWRDCPGCVHTHGDHMSGQIYLERGGRVVILKRWGPGGGPRNVLVKREDGERVVRPFRGLRRVQPVAEEAGKLKEEEGSSGLR